MAQKVLLSSFSRDSRVVYRRLYKAKRSCDALLKTTDHEQHIFLGQQLQSRLWRASVRFTCVKFEEQPKLVDYSAKSRFVGIDTASLMLGISLGLDIDLGSESGPLSDFALGNILANIDPGDAATILLRVPFYRTNEMLAIDEHFKLGLYGNTSVLPLIVPPNNPYRYYSTISGTINTMFYYGDTRAKAIEILSVIRGQRHGRELLDTLFLRLQIDLSYKQKILDPGNERPHQLLLPFGD